MDDEFLMREEHEVLFRQAYQLILEFFKQDKTKAKVWMNTFNPNLGASPLRMIHFGMGEKLIRWILNQLDENKPPSHN